MREANERTTSWHAAWITLYAPCERSERSDNRLAWISGRISPVNVFTDLIIIIHAHANRLPSPACEYSMSNVHDAHHHCQSNTKSK